MFSPKENIGHMISKKSVSINCFLRVRTKKGWTGIQFSDRVPVLKAQDPSFHLQQ